MKYTPYVLLLAALCGGQVHAEPLAIDPAQVSLPTTEQDLPGCGIGLLTEANAKLEHVQLGPDKNQYMVEWGITNPVWSEAFPNSIYGLIKLQVTCTQMTRWLDDAERFNRVQAAAAHERVLESLDHGVHEGDDHFTVTEPKHYGALGNAYQNVWEHTSPSNFGQSRHLHIDVYGSHGKMRIHILVHFVGFELSDNPDLIKAGAVITAENGAEFVSASPVVTMANGGHVIASTTEQNLDYVGYVLASAHQSAWQ